MVLNYYEHFISTVFGDLFYLLNSVKLFVKGRLCVSILGCLSSVFRSIICYLISCLNCAEVLQYLQMTTMIMSYLFTGTVDLPRK